MPRIDITCNSFVDVGIVEYDERRIASSFDRHPVGEMV